MNDCRRTQERLTPFVDGELSSEEQQAVEHHLNKCPPCRTTAAREHACRDMLRQRAPQLRAATLPPGLRTRCEALARSRGGGTRRWWESWRLVPSVITALLILATTAVLLSLASRSSSRLLAAQLTLDHGKCFREVSPTPAAVDARGTEEDFARRQGWDLHIPPSSPASGVTLVGARTCLYLDGRVPHVMYDVSGQRVSLYILEGQERSPADVTTFGQRARIWSRGPTSFVLVSNAGAPDLDAALSYMREEAH